MKMDDQSISDDALARALDPDWPPVYSWQHVAKSGSLTGQYILDEEVLPELSALRTRVVELEGRTMRMDSDAEARIVLCGELEDALAGLLEHVDHSDEKLLGPVEELMRRKQAARDALGRAREGLSSVRKEMDAESIDTTPNHP